MGFFNKFSIHTLQYNLLLSKKQQFLFKNNVVWLCTIISSFLFKQWFFFSKFTRIVKPELRRVYLQNILNSSIVIILCVYITFIYGYFFKWAFHTQVYKTLFIIFLLYLIINWWFYFHNIYTYSKYTSQTQRFWKRTFMLFWIIEGFLFTIYIYLFLISPAEPRYFYDIQGDDMFSFTNTKYSYAVFFILFLMLTLQQIGMQLKKHSSFLLSYIMIFILLLLVYLVIFEFYKFYYVLNYLNTSHLTLVGLPNTATNSISSLFNGCWTDSSHLITQTNWVFTNTTELYKTRTSLQFIILIVLLKFWHIFLIFLLFFLTIHKLASYRAVSFDLLSVNYQNTLYILFFYLTFYITFFKNYVYLYFQWVYYWIGTNNNFNTFFTYLIAEFQPHYII